MNGLHFSNKSFQLRKSSFQYRLITFISIAGCFWSLGNPSFVVAQETRTYTDITQDEFDTCVRTNKTDQGYAKYLSGNRGKVELWTTILFDHWIVGTLIYNFDPSNNTLKYNLIQANFPASEGLIWDGLNNMIERCGGIIS